LVVRTSRQEPTEACLARPRRGRFSESNDTTLALSALQRALDHRRPAPGLLHHSDRGSPYGSDDYVAALKRHGIKRSMSRKGDCWDNAVAESFFASLEHECVRDQTFVSPGAATRTVESYIDNFYNPERLHSTLGYFSPIEFELRSALHQEAA
jgi:transposase InsO family protein